jgi:tRNA dimethylallyltransferase
VSVLAGPTASGKSAAALQLARAHPELGIEVISADALQGYRGFDIGTAKPSAADRAAVPHHLIDFLDPTQRLDVALWTRTAEAAIADVLARGGRPLVVAGTGFYLDALERGLPTTPPAQPELRAQLESELARSGLAPLLAELQRAAPADALASQGNPRRVLRALEVLRASGRPPSAYPREPARFALRALVALPDADALTAHISARLQAMVAAGWLAEVEGLLASVPREAPAWQAIGYLELAAVVRNERPLAEALAATTLATVRYAKRQRTWFARRPNDAVRWPVAFAASESSVEAWFLEQSMANHV